MAVRSQKLCNYPGCKNVVPHGTPYCHLHQTPQQHLCRTPGCKNVTTETYCEECKRRYQQLDNKRRAERFKQYPKQWRQLSKLIRQEEPLCRLCLERGIYKPSQCVDHIDGNSKNNTRENLQALCWSCHSRKTVQENGGFGMPKTGTRGEGI